MATITKLDLLILEDMDIKSWTDSVSFQTLAVIFVVKSVVFTAYQVYQRYFSEAAKTCEKKSGQERTDCINDYKTKGRKEYNTTIKNGMSKCDKSKDPEKCRQLLKDKMKS